VTEATMAEAVARALEAGYRDLGIEAVAVPTSVDLQGARVVG